MKNRSETDTFGINMKKWCRAHEAFLAGKAPSEALLALHRERLRNLQHERLVHLVVTLMVVLAELFVLDLVLLHPALGLVPALVMLALAVLLGFYFYHYFFLENTVQRWYRIEDGLVKALGAEQKP